MKWQISKRMFRGASGTGFDGRTRRYALQTAAVATAEALELRMLLATTFANLPYADPFPATSQLGQASQSSSSVLYSESFTDQSGASNGVLGATDHYWTNRATVTRALPATMQNGLAQISVEFWVNVPAGAGIGSGTPISMPGFQVTSGGNWARTPNGIVSMTFSTTKSGEPLENLNSFLGVIADGQWHQYVATFDGRTASFYEDGELVNQNWLGNSADKVGPQVFSGATVSTPSAITYTPVNTGAFDEVRVSNVALTPWQVKRNFENDHNYSSTWYVSPTGLATNSGTRTSPLDLVTALTHVAGDNKIVLMPGVYNGAQFQVTRSASGALHNALITGDDGSGQVIIQTSGSGTGPTVSGGAKYVTLRNLTFSSDQQAGLTFSAAGIGNVVDSCRLTSNVDALSVVNSSGLQDPMNGDNAHYIIVPAVMLQNSIVAAGPTSAGVRYNNSKVIIARNNTFVGGRYGAYFTGASTDVTLLNNVFTGQTGSGVYFNSDSLMDVDAANSLVSYFGDGNIYNPASGRYVATVVDATTNNYSTVSDYAKYWYTKQYGTAILSYLGDVGAGIGYRSEQRSIRGTPTFVSSAGGDYRLAAVAPNLVDTGAAQVFGRTAIGVSPTVWDGQGSARSQGNAVDAGAYETAGAVSNTFTVNTVASTSAGVYDSSGKLVRTLWSGVKYPAGPVTAYWNGLNDNNVAMGNGSYTIKLLSNNVQYVWNGGMNTSNPNDGPYIQGNFYPIQSMVIVGANAYYAPAYNEGRYLLYKFNLSNINQVTGYAGLMSGSDLINSIASEGATLYTLWQINSNSTTVIKAYDLNLNPAGLTATVGSGLGAAAIAVQPAQQNLVFVAHTTDNKIYLYNKSNFTAYTTAYLDGPALGWNTPKSITTTPDGDLWVTCKNTSTGQWQIVRYTNFAGTPTLAATVTGGLVNPLGIAVSLDGNKTLMVSDGESGSTVSQQIKAYTPAGASMWTLGQAGGYATNGPTITNDKFILQGMICPQSDGSFWITDLATENRTMHFSAARTFINDIQYARSYSAAGDQNNATRVFQNFVEYQIDYSKPYTQNQGWTPVKNWSYLGTKDLTISGGYGSADGLAEVVTMSNGRTYAMIGTNLITSSSADVGKYSIVELTATGLRNTPYVTGQYSGYWLDKDGSLIRNVFVNNNTQVQYNRLALTGFDASGNPKYAATATVLATAAVTQTWDSQSPADSYGLPSFAPMFLQLDNGLLLNYSPQAHGPGMHLGAVDPATGQWQWLAMPASGPFSGNGNYDTANWYGGNRVMANGSNIIVGYHGEGWRNAGQAGQFMQYNQDGLFIGQFGTPSLNAGRTWPNAYGFSGNSFSPFLVANGNSLYLYANDESDRSLQRWQATGLDTIQETSASVSLGAPAAPSGMTATAASSTQINLTWTDNSNNETAFKVERATDSGFTHNLTLVTTTAANVTSYSNTGLAANTTYYYRVRATNAGVDSANSSTAGPVMPLLQINGDQGFAGQNDQIRVARNSADPSLLDVFLNGATPIYSVSFAALNTIVINGLGGDDTITLDLANGPVTPAGGISYDGGTQISGDNLIIAGSSGNDAVTFAGNQLTIGSGIVTLTGVENRFFKGGAGNDSLTLGAGSYTFASDLGLDTAHLSLTLADGAQVAFSGIQHLSSLSLSGGSKVTLADGGQSTLVVQWLSVDVTGSLDLADNAVIVDYTGSSPYAAIYSLVASSAGNRWASNGIVSHTAGGGGSQYALGVADNSIANLASFAGQPVDGTSVLIRFTYTGDANLDGQVDLADLSILASSWQMAGRQWCQGDFNYSDSVDLTDLSLLASNWQKILPTPVGMAVSLSSEVALVSQPVDAAAADGEAVADDPTRADAVTTQTASAAARTMTSSGAIPTEEATAGPSVESSRVAQPGARDPVVIATVGKRPMQAVVASEQADRFLPVTPVWRSAGVFSNRPLWVAGGLAPWPLTSEGTRTLLGSERLGVSDRGDILVRQGYSRLRR